MPGKLIIFSAPSGSGKTSIISHLMQQGLPLTFSVSATSRPPRNGEQNGVDYFFLTPQRFEQLINEKAFLEYEEVYPGKLYGTLRSQIDKQLAEGNNIVLDVDVNGACNIKQLYKQQALSIFIQPPSIEELQRRLQLRGTDTPQVISDRIRRATYELTFAHRSDVVIINDNLQQARKKTIQTVCSFINTPLPENES